MNKFKKNVRHTHLFTQWCSTLNVSHGQHSQIGLLKFVCILENSIMPQVRNIIQYHTWRDHQWDCQLQNVFVYYLLDVSSSNYGTKQQRKNHNRMDWGPFQFKLIPCTLDICSNDTSKMKGTNFLHMLKDLFFIYLNDCTIYDNMEDHVD